MNRDIVFVDIDHCISNAFPRDDMIGAEGGWDDYHRASINDAPVHDIVDLIHALAAAKFQIIGITARPAKWRMLTTHWLIKHSIPIHHILMRPDDDYRPAKEIKISLAVDFFGSEENLRDKLAFIIDDHPEVVEAFAGLGVTALQVFARRS